jgi:hypothetical protein
MTNENLWGDLPVGDARMMTPMTVLKEQANLLDERTNGVLLCRVYVLAKSPNIELDMDVIAPALDSYRYTLLRVSHPVLLYPLEMTDLTREKQFLCANEQEFRRDLRQILSSPEVHKVISALLSQSKPQGA